jgi:hypothetical protein
MSKKAHRQKDWGRLRRVVDGNDPFMQGHDVRGGAMASHASRCGQMQESDPWAFDNKLVRELIDRVFPEWRTDARQYKQSTAWIGIIQLYFRVCLTASVVAIQMRKSGFRKVGAKDVEDYVRRIRQAARSQGNTKGKPRKPMGRPIRDWFENPMPDSLI